MAQERPVLQDGFQGTGAAGGVDNAYMLQLLSKPETIYGRLWGKDMAAGKIYVETGGGALVTIKLGPETNVESFKALGVGNDVEVQAKRNYRRLGAGAFAADIPDGDPIALSATVLRAADNPTNLVPQAGYNPDTDRAIFSKDSSTMGGEGGKCFQCYEGAASDYGK
ncbi:MAG: hypothetical protein EPO02_06975 [Nitrospirae bacterium]|nr:MAG: hypothetical protein EPO02_06975 [Nitrospirota bacterium]